MTEPKIASSLGKAELHRILVRGHDLDDLVGTVTFSDMLALMLLRRLPDPQQRRMLDALLVVLVEHGLVKSTVTARFIYSNAPESIQAAVAGALLGAGSVHLGSSEWCARMLQEGLPSASDDAALDSTARGIVDGFAERQKRIPGIGHRTHAEGDPRAERLFQIARETGTYGRHCALLAAISAAATARSGRALAVNVTGAIAAIASDMGFRWEITRAFPLLARALGALAHVQEEIENPTADQIVRGIQSSMDYRASPEAL